MNTATVSVDEYVHMLSQLSSMKGDVLGFTDLSSDVRLLIADSLWEYRKQLRKQGRKDRMVITAKSESIHVNPAAAGDVLLVNRLVDYDFDTVFDIAICDGIVFISRLENGKVNVSRTHDTVTYHAYVKLFTDLWVSSITEQKDRPHSLTMSELRALLTPNNVASAHNLHLISPRQERIINDLPAYWRSIHHTQQAEVEQAFLKTFFEMRRAPHALASGKNYINYSSSVLTALVGNFLRAQNVSVSLITPCVDLIPDLLKDSGIIPAPLEESILHDPETIYEKFSECVRSDVLFLVNPNNPTGFCLDEFGEKGYREVARFCRDHGKTLIIDMCFMPFVCRDPTFEHIDCYKLFDEYDISYIIIEDSGKFLPTMDMKAAILHVSSHLLVHFDRMHSTLLLRHSPFIIKVVTAFVEDAMQTNIKDTDAIISRNLAYFEAAMEALPLRVERRQAHISIAWVLITDPQITTKHLQEAASNANIEVLSGNTFFWDDPNRDDRHIRIALARDEVIFRETVDQLKIRFETTPQEIRLTH